MITLEAKTPTVIPPLNANLSASAAARLARTKVLEPKRPRAIVAHSFWGRGGAETAAMWIIAALARDFDVTVYTRGGFDAEELASLAAVPIDSLVFKILIADAANAWPTGKLSHAAYVRSLKHVGSDFDLRVTASGIMLWGLPALHFLSSAIWHPTLAARFKAPHFENVDGYARKVLCRLSKWLSGTPARSLEHDIFVANSTWTASQSMPFCPRPIRVICPAVPRPNEGRPWVAREDGILVFGRVSPEKHIESCIEIVERVRSSGRHVHLCIAGPDSEPDYATHIDALCQARSPWIERHRLVLGEKKQELFGRFRYGLSACKIEAFGIATAEMTGAGVIVVAPEDCGQREILQASHQCYTTVDEAVSRLSTLVDDHALQSSLHKAALATREKFAPERFLEATRSLANQIVADRTLDHSRVR